MVICANHNREIIDNFEKSLKEKVYTKVSDLTVEAYITPEPADFGQKTSGVYRKLSVGEKWGKLWDCGWFHFIGAVPESCKSKKVVVIVDISGEGCVFDNEGNPIRGFTTVSCCYDPWIGRPAKRVLQLELCSKDGKTVDFWADCGCNDILGNFVDSGTLKEAHIAVCDEDIRQLYYDFSFLNELYNAVGEGSPLGVKIKTDLYKTAQLLVNLNSDTIAKARDILSAHLKKEPGKGDFLVSALGHSHLDLAWLWPIRETKRKAARTLSTVLELMDRYPDYIFGASQPQMFEWIKEMHPKLYEGIKEKVAQGRIECQGAMWVEPDTNLSGGEALARQILYGKKFFSEEFGKDMKILWMPDVFGYSAALPQLLLKSGVPYFMTNKIATNQINRFPHHTFMWKGIDGSEVLSHMPPEGLYNSGAFARSFLSAQNNFIDKDVSDNSLLLYGIGDGGCGAGSDFLERTTRAKKAFGLPDIIEEQSIKFFDRINKNKDNYAKWQGEIYYERHQGTLTSQAKNKLYNRKCELMLRDCEFISVLASKLCEYAYPAERLEKIWKEVLLYQFHDILPGSSIQRVFDESIERYEALLKEIKELTASAKKALTSSIDITGINNPFVLFNSLSFERTEWVTIDGESQLVTVPAMGWTVVSTDNAQKTSSEIIQNTDSIENEHIRAVFGKNGEIISLFEKNLNREFADTSRPFNQYMLYDDQGDAWDFSYTYREQSPEIAALVSSSFEKNQFEQSVTQIYKTGISELTVKISLRSGENTLRFECDADWRETFKMLRVTFPTDIVANEASCETQYGHIRRSTHYNTSWDAAKVEVSMHKWVDVSDNSYGLALLNDCKYGCNIWDCRIDMCLLRSPMYPGIDADKGLHSFAYALCPHDGTLAQSDIIQTAYRFNIPLEYMISDLKDAASSLPSSFTLLSPDKDNIIVEAVKQAEDGNGIIVRLYESRGMSGSSNISLFAPAEVRAVSITEIDEDVIIKNEKNFTLNFHPFEIHTVRILFK